MAIAGKNCAGIKWKCCHVLGMKSFARFGIVGKNWETNYGADTGRIFLFQNRIRKSICVLGIVLLF